MKVLQEEEGEKHPGVGNSSHIHRQIRGHPLREQPPKPMDAGWRGTHGGRRVRSTSHIHGQLWGPAPRQI